jgi:phytoene desaturase
MRKMKTVAIIGGGVSGLAAGGLLSRNGIRVRLFEANHKLGGCCANTYMGGYTFHDGAQYLAFPGVLKHVFGRLGLDHASRLPIRKIIANQTTTLPDGSAVTFGDGLDVTLRRNGQARNGPLQKELDLLVQKWAPVFRLFAEDMLLHPFSIARLAAKSWRHLAKFRGTVAAEITRLFSDEAVRAAMSGILLYTGQPPQTTPVTSILGLVAMLCEGFYLPVGGMGKIPEALSQALTRYGGEIHLNTKVNQIVTKEGMVHGLEIEGQGFVEADAVISTASGMATYNFLVDADTVPIRLHRKVQQAPLSHKAMVVQLGLSNQIDVSSHTNSLLPMMLEQEKVFLPVEDELAWPVYSVPTVTAPEMAPQGGSVIEMFPPTRQSMPADDWTPEQEERIAQTAMRALARLHKMEIVVKRTLSPKHYQNQLHLYHGAAYGLALTADPRAYFSHETPIDGLYLAGQTTYPGYGVSSAAMSGILAAETMMRKEH